MWQQQDSEESFSAYLQDSKKQAEFFRILGPASLLYALVYTFCLFENASGITVPVFAAATVFYVSAVRKRLKNGRTQGGKCYVLGMLLLGVSTCMTDHKGIIAGNYLGFLVLLLLFLIQQYDNDTGWGFGKHVAELLTVIFGACGCMLTPFVDGGAFYREKKKRKNQTLRAVLIGLLCAVPGLLVLGAFLISADAVFGAMAGRVLSLVRMPLNAMRMVLLLLFGFFSSYCGMRFLCLQRRQEEQVQRVKLEPVAAITFTGPIAAMYVVFCGIQVVYLFAGQKRLPDGIGYAQYARSGFFQLLFVCMVNFVLVLLLQCYFKRHKVLDALLLLLCVCTFIMTASSAYRMFLYIGSYQLTFLRVLVLAALAVLALFMGGAMASVLKPQFPLFRYCVAVAGMAYLIVSFSHADYLIASYNLSHAADLGQAVDWAYLSRLSMDAAPAVFSYQKQASKEQQAQMRQSALQAKKRLESGSGAQGYLRYGEQIPYESPGAYSPGENNGTGEEAPVYDSYEAFYEAQWYGMYVYKVYEAQKNMNLRNFNFSRYLALKNLDCI
ncbi:MAG: DUF4173 domain-containing protein [Eubacterium sp.]|nr:DUF4173 domain-containing protein [Eubacterium sp.]